MFKNDARLSAFLKSTDWRARLSNQPQVPPMQKSIGFILKIVGVIVSLLVVGDLVSGSELTPHLGTVALAVAASILALFGRSFTVRTQSLALLALVVVVSRGVDYYFWVGVWERGYPWPYPSDGAGQGGVAGSIAPFVYQVSVVSFVLLSAFALAGVIWHLTLKTSPVKYQYDEN